jgi:hypothetical protein
MTADSLRGGAMGVTLTPDSRIGSGARTQPGPSLFPRVVVVRATRGDGFLTTEEAARLVGVKAGTIRQWRKRGYLLPQGLDERDRPLHTPAAVREAEKAVRKRGLEKSGVDPRQLRGRSKPVKAA